MDDVGFFPSERHMTSSQMNLKLRLRWANVACVFSLNFKNAAVQYQIVKSRDNSPADELDLCFTGCPEGLQFQNRRKLSRRNWLQYKQQVAYTDSDHSWWVRKRSTVKYMITVKMLKSQCFLQSQAKDSADTS